MDGEGLDCIGGKTGRAGAAVAITQAAPTEKPKEKPKPKRRPPALPEDRKEVQEKWALLRNDVEDAVLKGMLSKVEIGFKEDEFLYLICAYPALTDMIQRGMDKIAAVLEKETGKSFELRTPSKHGEKRHTARRRRHPLRRRMRNLQAFWGSISRRRMWNDTCQTAQFQIK